MKSNDWILIAPFLLLLFLFVSFFRFMVTCDIETVLAEKTHICLCLFFSLVDWMKCVSISFFSRKSHTSCIFFFFFEIKLSLIVFWYSFLKCLRPAKMMNIGYNETKTNSRHIMQFCLGTNKTHTHILNDVKIHWRCAVCTSGQNVCSNTQSVDLWRETKHRTKIKPINIYSQGNLEQCTVVR